MLRLREFKRFRGQISLFRPLAIAIVNLAREWFDTLLEAQVLIERWRRHYNIAASPQPWAALDQTLRDELPEADRLENAAAMVSWFAEQTGIPSKLSSIGIEQNQLDEILDDSIYQDMQNNARPIDRPAADELQRSFF